MMRIGRSMFEIFELLKYIDFFFEVWKLGGFAFLVLYKTRADDIIAIMMTHRLHRIVMVSRLANFENGSKQHVDSFVGCDERSRMAEVNGATRIIPDKGGGF